MAKFGLKFPLNTKFFIAVLVLLSAVSIEVQAKDKDADKNAAAAFFEQYNEISTARIDHSKYQQFLDNNLQENSGDIDIRLFDYDNISDADKQLLKSYLADMAKIVIIDYNRDVQYAFWLNLYNAVVLDMVLDFYPIEIIGDIKKLARQQDAASKNAPWDFNRLELMGWKLTLDIIEHDILREIFKDWRIHTTINAAAYSSGSWQKEVYRGDVLNTQLEAAARDFMGKKLSVAIDDDILRLSSAFKWYREDFGETDEDILAIIQNYASEERRIALSNVTEIEYFFDWSLNDFSPLP